MKRILIAVLLAVAMPPVALLDSQTEEVREVIIATQRNRRLHVFDANTLEPLGYFAVNSNAHSVTASPDGRTLFIEQPAPPNLESCCTLFALDLATGAMCQLIFPSGLGVPSPDGRLLFTQRGAIGIDAFDAKTLMRLPTIKAPGVYVLYPSPDSRWLLGTTSWSGPSLDIFDLEQMMLVRRLQVPSDGFPRGAWVGDSFYLYADDMQPEYGNLWRITPEAAELGLPVKISIPNSGGSDTRGLKNLIAAGDRLFLYEMFGHKLDRRYRNKKIPGGLYAIEPATGEIKSYMAPSAHFARLVASSNGENLYGLDSGKLQWGGPVRLLKMDAGTGKILAKRTLETDVWHISLARIPGSLVPRGEVNPMPCQASR